LEMDQEKAAKKLLLDYDSESIKVPFFKRLIALNRSSAEMSSSGYAGEVPLTHKLLALHHIYYHLEDAANSGQMVAFREVRECAVFDGAYRRNTLLPFAAAFEGKAGLLRERAAQLGGAFLSYGDVSFELSAFPLIKLQYIFWDGDEEFPANASVLFDQNIAQFIHAESIPVLADAGARLLMEGSVPSDQLY